MELLTKSFYIITQVVLICSRLWSIRGQLHDWRHHYKVVPSDVLKWGNVLRIRIIFYVTGQKIRYKKVLPRHWTGSRSQKTKDKAVSFRKWYRNNFLAAPVGSWARLNHAQTVSREPLLYLGFNKPNKQNVSEINLFKKIQFFPVSKQLLTHWLISGMKQQNVPSRLKIGKIKYITLLSDAHVPVRFRAQ